MASSSRAAPSPSPSALLRLPNETLLNIASKVTGPWRNRALSSLSLTCHRLRPIAQETLVKYCTVHGDSLFKVAQYLVKYPEMPLKMSHLEIGPTDRPEGHGKPAKNYKTSLYPKSCALIDTMFPDTDNSDWKDYLQASKDLTSTDLSIILAAVPKLTSVTVTQQSAMDHEIFNSLLQHALEPPFAKSDFKGSALLNKIRGQLQVLKISAPPIAARTDPSGLNYIALQRFTNLTHAMVPFQMVITEPYIATFGLKRDSRLRLSDPKDVLPSSLQRLELSFRYHTSMLLVRWMHKLMEATKNELPKLRKVKLHFLYPVHEFSDWPSACGAQPEGPRDMRKVLLAVGDTKISLQGLFQTLDGLFQSHEGLSHSYDGIFQSHDGTLFEFSRAQMLAVVEKNLQGSSE